MPGDLSQQGPFGLLNVDKPSGITSRAVVDHVKRLVRPAKTGHAGTLDPLASGVLLIVIGQATRLVDYLHAMPKTYRASFILGRESPTEDIEGEVQIVPDAPIPLRSALDAAVPKFVGRIQQRPSSYSAIKVAGRRAYDLARSGKEVELEPREIEIFRLEVFDYMYPDLLLDIECSGGTYIRALGRDLAESLGTSCVMRTLCRTSIGGFRLADACTLEQLYPETLETHLLPATRAVESLPTIQVSEEQAKRLWSGNAIQVPLDSSFAVAPHGECAIVDPSGRLAAVARMADDRRIWPVRNFPLEP